MAYNYSDIVQPLLQWFDENKRELPWRDDPKPYYVWVSEIMLQQTRVEAVKGYFARFLNELPTIKDLANVEDDKLMKLWEGLGYYNRARNLKKAANVVMEEYQGELPADFDKLLKLPGIGSYTAGAVGSIAYQLPVPAVDGNVLRVCKRVAGSFDDITKDKVKKELEQDIRMIIPRDRPGDFNQSLMELGAMVCIPNGKPLCDQCPLAFTCEANHKNLWEQIPVKPAKKARKIEDRTILVIEYDKKYAIRKREKKGLLAGLWELPSLEGKLTKQQMEEYLFDHNIKTFRLEPLEKAKHIFSHIEWHMVGYKLILDAMPKKELIEGEPLMFVTGEEVEDKYSLPTAFVAYRNSIHKVS